MWVAVGLWSLSAVWLLIVLVFARSASTVSGRLAIPWTLLFSKTTQITDHGENTPNLFYEGGRFSISDKVAFFENAEHEVIEFGLGLSTFSSYFRGRRPAEFRNPILLLLERGVRYKCVMLDPNSPFTEPYLADIGEPEYLNRMRDAIETLKSVQSEFHRLNLPGTLELYTYSHSPFMYACSVDGAFGGGKMQVSNYLFGARRSECPVLVLTKADNSQAFATYWRSLTAAVASSTRI